MVFRTSAPSSRAFSSASFLVIVCSVPVITKAIPSSSLLVFVLSLWVVFKPDSINWAVIAVFSSLSSHCWILSATTGPIPSISSSSTFFDWVRAVRFLKRSAKSFAVSIPTCLIPSAKIKLCNGRVLLFSIAGLPPLAGFFGKLYILISAIESKLYILSIVAILTSIVSAFYYLRIIKIIFFDEPVNDINVNTSIVSKLIIIISIIFSITLILFVSDILELINSTSILTNLWQKNLN